MKFSFWFDQAPRTDRRSSANSLKRAAMQSEDCENSIIDRWLDLAKRAFDSDQDRENNSGSQAA